MYTVNQYHAVLRDSVYWGGSLHRSFHGLTKTQALDKADHINAMIRFVELQPRRAFVAAIIEQ